MRARGSLRVPGGSPGAAACQTPEGRGTLLGPVAAATGEVELALGGLKQRGVFALMALNAGRGVPLDRLVDELWSEEPPSRATLSLQSYVARLRRMLSTLTVLEGDAPRILTRPPGWVL